MPARPFAFKTSPFPLQRDVVKERWRQDAYALLWQQRCGKSKVLLDDFAINALNQIVDTLVITAPAGVHIGWVREQIPQHLAVEASCWLWDSRKALAARTKAEALGTANPYTDAIKSWCATPGYKVFAHNIDSINTEYGAAVVKYVLCNTAAMWAIDEADDLTDPTSARATTVLSLARYARKRRVLSGTLATGGPFAYYAPMAFLDPYFWRRPPMAIPTVTRFKHYFGEFEQKEFKRRGASDGSSRGVWVLAKDEAGKKKYRNLDVFTRLVHPHVSRVLQSDVYPHFAALQRPIVSTEFFALGDAQRHAYRQLQREYVTVAPSGKLVDGASPATRMMRLHQIACGYVGVETGEPAEVLPGPNPRIEALLRAVARLGDGEKAVVWTAFQLDQVLVTQALRAAGYTCGRYDGSTLGTREADKRAFLDQDDPRILVGNMQALSRGHDLTRANHEIVYSYPYRLLHFAQAVERLKGPNQTRPIFRHWIVAMGTVDEKIRRAYQHDQEIADVLTGDPRTDLLGLDAETPREYTSLSNTTRG